MSKFLLFNRHYQLNLFLELSEMLDELSTFSSELIDFIIVNFQFNRVSHLIDRHDFSKPSQQLISIHSRLAF